ncbi:MAG: hypothetical protein HOW73_26575 [Polyangiaceae bacterium]|nr:hypothetical protein [Polyangiaceae bacterium]
MTRTILQTLGIALLGVAFMGCAEKPTKIDNDVDHDKDDSDPIGDPIDKPTQPEDTTGSEDNTHDHMPGLGADDARDPYEIAKQREEEGTPDARARLHSCQKLQITAVRNVLTDFGVNLDAEGTPPTAGQLVNGGGTALGAANYAARMGEDIVWTAAGAAKMFDIWVQAAPEIIAAMPTAEHCMVDGVGVEVFTDDGQGTITCNEDAVTCLIGRPATPEHLAICNSLVMSASTPDKGKNIAVAALLSAAHSCE